MLLRKDRRRWDGLVVLAVRERVVLVIFLLVAMLLMIIIIINEIAPMPSQKPERATQRSITTPQTPNCACAMMFLSMFYVPVPVPENVPSSHRPFFPLLWWIPDMVAILWWMK